MQDVANGLLPNVLLLGIISLSARFSNDQFFQHIDPRVRGRPYAQEAEHLLNLREVSLTTIQATVLIGAYAITEGDAQAYVSPFSKASWIHEQSCGNRCGAAQIGRYTSHLRLAIPVDLYSFIVANS